MRTNVLERLYRRSYGGGNAVVGILALTVVAACGNPATGTDNSDMAAVPLPPDLSLADLKDNSYPRGPYGQSGNFNQGDVLPDFTFQGYFSPNTTTGKASSQPFGEVTLGMLRDSGAKYAILNLSAFW